MQYFNKVKTLVIFILFILMMGCASIPQDTDPPLPIEIQAIQTQTFEATKQEITDATITTLQNIGFQIQNADYASGIIMAETNATVRDYDFASTIATVTLTERGDKQTSVNINLTIEGAIVRTFDDGFDNDFQYTNVNLYREQQINPGTYQKLFDNISQTLFRIQANR